jgi:hypothetical protein
MPRAVGLTLLALLALLTPLAHLAAPALAPAQTRREFAELHMGVETRLVLYAPDDASARRAARAAFDRIAALEDVGVALAELDRLRALELCLLVPAAEAGFRRAFFVSGGRVVAARTLLPGEAGRVELEAGLAEVARAEASLGPADTDELLLIGSILRRPPPELRVIRLAEVRAAA